MRASDFLREQPYPDADGIITNVEGSGLTPEGEIGPLRVDLASGERFTLPHIGTYEGALVSRRITESMQRGETVRIGDVRRWMRELATEGSG